jgi:hypothetical protein
VSQFDDAKSLVAHSEARLAAIRTLHDECLRDREIKPALLIEIKNFMENLRSALDYCAAALFAKYGHTTQKHPRIYFPYATHKDDRKNFLDKIVERSIPGLLHSRPDIVKRLE